MSRQTQAHLYSELARQELRSRDFKKAAGYVKETLKTFVQHNKFAVERDGIRAVIQTLLPEELFRWLPVRLSLWRCEKHQTSTRYSSDLLDAPSTSSGSLSSRSSDRGSIFDLPEVETGDLSDDTKASVEGLLVKSRHFRQHAESLLAVATTELETSRVSKEIKLLGEGNPRPKHVTNLISTASPALKLALTGALVEDPDIRYLVNHPGFTQAGLDALASLQDKFAAIKAHREKIHTICQRVGHQRNSYEPEVPKYSAIEFAETVPGFVLRSWGISPSEVDKAGQSVIENSRSSICHGDSVTIIPCFVLLFSFY